MSKEKPPIEPYDVGYKKPPTATQFQTGNSGNPAGRPKGSLNRKTVLLRSLKETVTIIENGRKRKITKLEAAMKQLANKVASGDLAAIRMLWSYLQDIEGSGAAVPDAMPEGDQAMVDLLLRNLGVADGTDLSAPTIKPKKRRPRR